MHNMPVFAVRGKMLKFYPRRKGFWFLKAWRAMAYA